MIPSRLASPRWRIVLLMWLLACGSASAAHFTTLYHFTNGTDGEGPYGGLVQDATGALYGTTSSGGDPSCHRDCTDFGTLFSFSGKSGLKTLIDFTGPNGGGPSNTLLLSGTTLYGNTYSGGAGGDGVIFSVKTNGTGYTLLHQFSGADGMTPTSTPRLGAGGLLYGITSFGGLYGDGVLFSIAPNGTYTILHNFTGGTDGNRPDSLLISSTGELFGSTQQGGATSTCVPPQGCGVMFTYTPANSEFAIAYAFSTTSGGSPLLGSIGPGPTVYGTTLSIAQTANDVFAIGPSGFRTVATLTDGASGVQYLGPTLAPDGSLVLSVGPSNYGGYGGLDDIKGGAIVGSVGFNGGSMGGAPAGQPLVTPNGTVFGTTSYDGACGECGTIYEVTQ